MAENNRIAKAETLSFVQLMDKGFSITIPMIQRDYAQGRTNARITEIRENFVSDLHNAIHTGRSLSLEFVYGSCKDGAFIPLDGQQRLTTLFLLHTYIDGLCPCSQQRSFKLVYQTRDSSQRFCQQLVSHRAEIFNRQALSVFIDDEPAKPSTVIENQPWWFSAWNDDPTVSGMLTMLDEIHKQFFEYLKDDEVAQRVCKYLYSDSNNGIIFQFLPLDEFYDPDDLYMKMNARGLALTPFEIFKSRWIDDVERLFTSEESKEIKKKIDVYWTDFLWPMRNGMKNIDDYLQRLFKMLIASLAAVEQDIKGDNLDYLFEANQKSLVFSYNRYKSYGVEFNRKLIEQIVSGMDQMCCSNSLFVRYLRDEQRPDVGKIWDEKILGGASLEYRDRVIMYAMIYFSEKFPNAERSEYRQWKRIVYNLLASQAINNSSEMARAVRNIDALLNDLYKTSSQGLDVNGWVASSIDLKNTFFYDYIWQEEVVKAELRKDERWCAEIEKAEQDKYLDGQISIIMHMAGLIPAYAPFALPVPKVDIDEFKKWSDLMLPLFDEIGDAMSTTVKEHLMVRAMLVKGDYMPWSSSYRKNFYNIPGHRDYSWKSLFAIRLRDKDNHIVNGCAINCLREILEDPLYDACQVEKSLREIGCRRAGLIPKTEIWRRLLTSRYYLQIMKKSHQGFIAFDNDNVLIYGSSQRNGYHSELRSLYLFELLRDYGYDLEYNLAIGSNRDFGLSIGERRIYFWDGIWHTNDEQKKEIDSLGELKRFIRDTLDKSGL